MAVTGYGRAPKDQVQRMVQVVLGMDRAATPRRRGRCPRGRHLPGARSALGGVTRCRPDARHRDRVARGQVVASSAPIRGAQGRRRGLPGLRRPEHAGGPADGPGRPSCTPTTWCARTSRRSTASGRVEELGFFELLITVTGVGPKVGLAIVSSRPVADLQLAILQGDEAVLTAVSGVGKRLAGRIVLELKEKVAAAGGGRAARRARRAPPSRRSWRRSRRSATRRAESREAAQGRGRRAAPGHVARGARQGRAARPAPRLTALVRPMRLTEQAFEFARRILLDCRRWMSPALIATDAAVPGRRHRRDQPAAATPGGVHRPAQVKDNLAILLEAAHGARRGRGPRPALRPARPRQDHARQHHRPRAGRPASTPPAARPSSDRATWRPS